MSLTGRTARLARRTAAEFLDDRCPQLAAAIAYYALFAVFPLSILLVAGFGRVAGEETARREVTELVLDNVPLRSTEGRQEIADALDRVTAGAETFGVLGLAGLVFSASGLMGALRYALSRAFDFDLFSR